jgi:hypothetical protein
MLQSYAIAEYLEDGRVYVVVSVTGATFGQIIHPGTRKMLDRQVAEAAERYEAQLASVELPAIGEVRTSDEISAELGVVIGLTESIA